MRDPCPLSILVPPKEPLPWPRTSVLGSNQEHHLNTLEQEALRLQLWKWNTTRRLQASLGGGSPGPQSPHSTGDGFGQASRHAGEDADLGAAMSHTASPARHRCAQQVMPLQAQLMLCTAGKGGQILAQGADCQETLAPLPSPSTGCWGEPGMALVRRISSGGQQAPPLSAPQQSPPPLLRSQRAGILPPHSENSREQPPQSPGEREQK